MIACDPILREEIRAEVWMGDTRIARTPYIKSFNVTKSRGQFTNSFSINLEIVAGFTFPIGENIRILAGTKGNIRPIITGIIESTNSRPAFGKPNFYNLTIAGRGILSVLENKKFSRRLRADGQGLFCSITSGSANRPDAFYSLDARRESGNTQVLNSSPNPAKTFSGETSPLIVAPGTVLGASSGGGGVGTGSTGGIASIARQGGAPDSQSSSSDSLPLHTHEDLTQGGPAFGVYSSD